MSDYINKNVPVADEDVDGNYKWQQIRAGGEFSSIRHLTLVEPLNLGPNSFVYNGLDIVSAEFFKFNNLIEAPNVSPAAYSSLIPSPAGYLLGTSNASMLVDLNTGEIQNASGAEQVGTSFYVRFSVRSSSLDGQGDVIRVGFSINGATPAAGKFIDVAVNSSNGEFVVGAKGVNLDVPDTQKVSVLWQNLSSTARGVLFENVRVIGRYK